MTILDSGVAASTPSTRASAEVRSAPPHEHDWRQRAVLHEDGYATEEYGCAACGGVTFR